MKRADIPDQEILNACRVAHEAWRRGATQVPSPDIALADKYPPKLTLAKMQHMVERGLLEYGVSLRTAWVVEETDGH